MTMISSAMSATTPRSCVIMITAELKSSFSRSISSMICAWIVTSSAVVGSSAIRTSGLHESAIAIIARCRMPPENWCGKSSTRASGFGMPTWRSSSTARFFAPRLSIFSCDPDRLGDLVADPVDRVQRRHRVLEDHPELGAAVLLHLGVRHLQQVGALVDHLALEVRVHIAREAHQRHRRDALAGAGLADDPEHLAALELERDAVDRAHDAVLRREVDLQVVDVEERSAIYVGRIRGSRYA